MGENKGRPEGPLSARSGRSTSFTPASSSSLLPVISQDGVRSLLEADPYAELTPTELLLKLADVSDDRVTHSKDWPKTAASLSTQLRRLAPAFRCVGIEISLDDPKTGKRLRTTSGQRLIRLEKAGKTE